MLSMSATVLPAAKTTSGNPQRRQRSRSTIAPPVAPVPAAPSVRAYDRNLITLLSSAVREAELELDVALGAGSRTDAASLAAAATILRGAFTALADEVPELRAKAAFWLSWARLEETALRDSSSAMDVLSAGLVACR